jgi:hypothetical protein
MKLIRYVCITLTLCALAVGPIWAAPALSVSRPHLTAPTAPAPGPTGPHSPLRWLPFGAIGAIRVKDTGAVAAKFRTRASAAATDYEVGVRAAAGDWETNTAAAESNFEQGVQDAIGRKAFGKGVRGSGGKYVKNATELGKQRYPTGVANAEQAYAAGVGPFLDALKGMQLPPRGPKGSPQNMSRANAVAAALRAKKVGS